MRKPYHFLLSVLLFGYAAFSASAVTLDEARRLIDKKDYVQAAEAFRTLMKTRSISQRADCNKWYGEALCMTGHYDEAIPYLETAGKRQVKGAFGISAFVVRSVTSLIVPLRLLPSTKGSSKIQNCGRHVVTVLLPNVK